MLRILLISITVILIYLNYGALFGRDPGIAFLILMLAFKMLEMKSRRDVLIFLFLNYFVVVTNFLYNQNIALAVYMLAAVWLITTVLVQINRLADNSNFNKDARLAATLLAQALPIMVAMFLLFPRIETSLWKIPDNARSGSTGLSESMTPGDISQLIKSKKIAFRVKFNKRAPNKKQMYWRGPVLSLFDGRSWNSIPPQRINLQDYRLYGTSYNYTITLEATGSKYLPTLDLPATAPEKSYLSKEFAAYANFKINTVKLINYIHVYIMPPPQTVRLNQLSTLVCHPQPTPEPDYISAHS